MSIIRLTYSGNIYDSAPAGQQDFPLTTSSGEPIPYLSSDHIHVYSSDDDGVTWTELTRPSEWDFATPAGTVARLASGIAAGTWIRVQRLTPYQDLWTTFQESSQLTADQLNIGEKFSMYVDQELFDLTGSGWSTVTDTITRPQQLEGKWVSDDKHVATTGAISERLDAYVQDTKPVDPALTEIRQPGKIWIDDGTLQINYWDPGARAWINMANTGPVGPGATVAVGSTTTGAAGTNATVVNSGTASAAVLDFTIPRGADGAPGPAGAPGAQGPPGPPGSGANITFAANPPITVTETGASPKTVTYGFNIATLATIP